MKTLLSGFFALSFFGLLATNSTAQWKQIILPGEDTSFCLTAVASSGIYIYAGGSSGSAPILFRSSDNGSTWQSIGGSSLSSPVVALAATPNDVFAILQDNGTSYNVFWSSNAGNKWNNISPPHPAGISSSATSITNDGADLFIGTTNAGLYASNNNGSTWVTASGNYGDTIGLSPANNNIFALFGDNTTLYAGTGQGVYVAGFPEQGGGWIPENTGIASRKVNAITEIGSELFVGTDSGIFSSINSGSNWESSSPFPSPFFSLATNGKDFFAAIGNENGVDYSPDTGQDWYEANDGLSVQALIQDTFALTISGAYVYVATGFSGLWQRPVSNLDGVVQPGANEEDLSQNYPNPFSTWTTIHYTLSQEDHVSLAIYNMLGQKIALLKDDIEQSGSNQATFQTGALPSGLYCYRLSTTSGGTITRIMQIEK